MQSLPANSLSAVLRRQNLFLMILSASVLLGIIFFSAVLMVRDFVRDQELLVNTFVNETTGYLDETQALLRIESQALAAHSYEHAPNDIDFLLQVTKEKHPRFDSLYIMDERGYVLHEATDEFSVLGLDLSTEIYFSSLTNQSANLDEGYIGDLYISIATGDVSVIVAEGIWLVDGTFDGALVSVLNLNDLQREIDNSVSEDETVFIVDQYNKYVAHPDPIWVQEQRYYQSSDPIFNFNEQFELIYEEDQGGWNIRSRQATPQGWVVVVLEPVMIIIWPLILLLFVTLGATSLGLVVFYWNYRRLRQSLFQDLDSVVTRLEIISRGDYQSTLPRSGAEFHEIQIIYDSFARMVAAVIERDKNLERRVVARTAELEIANQELESFAYSVSHDLRAPLRAIDGFAYLLNEDYKAILNDEARIYLEQISKNSRRMDQLIGDILQLSRVVQQDLKREKFDLGELASQVFFEIQETKDSRPVEFTVPENIIVNADKKLVRVMLTNLLANAYKFTSFADLGKIGLLASEDKKSGQIIYSIEDNGVGFEMEYADKIFGPFQRLHSSEEFEGTGIGLAIVQRVVKRHGGDIWVESMLGEGTTFFFTLGE